MTVAEVAPDRHSLGLLPVAGILLASLAEAIAGTALSLGRADIIGDTYATPDEFAWLDICYTALKLIGFAFAPWLLTRIPPRNLLLAATLAMGGACALAALTTSLGVLIFLRAAQGLAGAVLLVSGQAVLFWSYPKGWQASLQALFAAGSVVAPATVAPALQGWLIDTQSWTWIFFGALPLSLASAGLLLMDDAKSPACGRSRALDWPGLALLSVALFAVTYVLSQGDRWDWFEEWRIQWITALGAAALALFLIHQRATAKDALFDGSVFKVEDFSFAFVVSFVAGAALFGSAYLIPAFAVSVLGFTPTEAGLLLLPSGALFVVSLLVAVFLIQGRGVPPVATVPFGILLVMTAMWMLSGSTEESGAEDMMPAILLRGLGLGFLFLSITLIAFSRLARDQVPFGIGIFNIGRQLGGLIGVAWLQTAIDHQAAANRNVLSSALAPGALAVTERLASTTSLLVGRGVETVAAGKVATASLGRVLANQAVVIAFDTAFALVALLFVAAVPAVILIKIALARTMRRCEPTALETVS